ncbi:MAG: dTDP-4-dehydrorhamnose reductase [Betaproteobacteria bacterium]|nr:dTDP-4-dehydrorhamnose reductase [Betaproteobacteria bacterium]
MAAILVTGAAGQLGHELVRALAPLGEVVGVDRSQLDLADATAIVATVRRVKPALIVNAGAYTAVDLAEQETALADAVNGVAPGVLADEAKRAGAVLVHYSTDYVFDGSANTPYDEDAHVRPLSSYGRSKLAGERAVAASGAHALVFRTSWVYGRRGRNFLLTMQRLARERPEIRVVDDQTGTPNWSRELARATARIASRGLPWLAERSGLYHMSATGSTTWYGFARAILADVASVRVVPITTADYPTPAARPAYGVLGTARFERTFGFALPDWRTSLAECLSSDPDAGAVGG